MPMSLILRPYSIKDGYRFFTMRQQSTTNFSQLSQDLKADTTSFSFGLVDDSFCGSTDTIYTQRATQEYSAENFVKLCSSWLDRLHKDKLAGEFNEDDLKEHIPPLENAMKKVKRLIIASQKAKEDWWEVSENVGAFEELMEALKNISNSRTTSAKLCNFAWQCLDCLLDALVVGAVATVFVGVLGIFILPALGATSVTGTALSAGSIFKGIFLGLFPYLVVENAVMSGSFNLFFNRCYERSITETAINKDMSLINKK